MMDGARYVPEDRMKHVGGGLFRLQQRAFFCLGILFLLIFVFFPSELEARFINLGGSLDFSYGEIKTASEVSGTDRTTFFQQRYNLHNYGELFNPQIGNLLINGTFLQQETKTNRRGDQDFEFTDYSVMANLFPYISPLSLYYQRMNRMNEINATALQNGFDVEDRQTTLGGNWTLLSNRLPRIRVSYNQSEFESRDDANRLPNTINRFFNLESSGRFRETTLTGRYQFNETDVARRETNTVDGRVETVRGNAFNLTTESRLAPGLIGSTYLRIANRSGGSAPGVIFAQERGFGGSISYAPSVKWDTHARVNFTETPSEGDAGAFKQQNAFWSGSYRPTEELDMVVSGRYFRFDVNDVETTSPFGDISVNYRPFFGFSTGLGASYGETQTKGGGADVSNTYQRYRGNVDYTRALELLRYSTRYAVSQGLSDTEGEGESRDIMHTVSLNVENTQIRYIHLSLGYTFNDVDRSQTGEAVQETGDQRSHLIQLNAASSYFRGILRSDDSLLLQSTASWTKIKGFGAAGESILLDGRGNYYFLPGAMLSAGYTRQDYPSGYYPDTNTYYEELSWSFYIGATSFNFSAIARQQRSDGDRILDRNTIQTSGGMSYRLGRFLLSADARWSEDKAETEGTDFESRSLFVRASRSF